MEIYKIVFKKQCVAKPIKTMELNAMCFIPKQMEHVIFDGESHTVDQVYHDYDKGEIRINLY